MSIYCGIDWADDHHDIAIIDEEGNTLDTCRISNDLTGFNQLLEVLATHGDTTAYPIPVVIETTRGLLVSCLRATGRD